MSDKGTDDDDVGKSAAKETAAPATRNEKKRVHEDDPDDTSERNSESKKHYSMGSDKLSPQLRDTVISSGDQVKEADPGVNVTKHSSKEQDAKAAPSAEAFAKSGFSSFSSAAKSPFASVNSAKSPFASGSSGKSPFASVGSVAGESSTKAPFAAGNTAEPPQSNDSAPTSSTVSAFGSSGFSAFSKTAQSPFGAFGSAKPVMSPDASASAEATVPNGAASTEAGTSQGEQSLFASATNKAFGSGFGSLGGNFSSGGLKTFASGNSTGAKTLGTTSFTAFGAGGSDDEADDDNEGNDDDEDESRKRGFLSPGHDEEDAQDDRFYEQEIETGEEKEQTMLTTRGKLYVKESSQWKERGVGTFKLNVLEPDDDSEPWAARFIMRADGTQKMLMNTPITPDIKVEDRMGGAVKSKSVIFMGFMDGHPSLCLLQMKSADVAEDLHLKTEFVKERMTPK